MSYDFVFKLIIVGEPSVGKSAICQQLTQKNSQMIIKQLLV